MEKLAREWIFKEGDPAAPSYLGAIEDRGNCFVVRLRGPMDQRALVPNRAKMTAVIQKFNLYSKNLLCNFKDVTRADSATVAALVSRLSDFAPRKNPNKLIFFNLRNDLKAYMGITHTDSLFQIYDAEEEALHALGNA